MRSRVWFAHGKVIENGFWCTWCSRNRTGRLIRDRYLWGVRLSCGHYRAEIGMTQPFEELERKGYINQKGSSDPRYLAKVKQEWLDFFARRQALKDQEKAEDLFSSHSLVH